MVLGVLGARDDPQVLGAVVGLVVVDVVHVVTKRDRAPCVVGHHSVFQHVAISPRLGMVGTPQSHITMAYSLPLALRRM